MQMFTPNTAGRDFVVGDLHGCYSLLMLALDKLAFDFKRDRLFSVGDLIDRGEQSEQCLKLLDAPWMHAIAGNHEHMFIDMLKSDAHKLHFLKNGGKWVLDADIAGFNDFEAWHHYWAGRLSALHRAATIMLPNGISIGLVHAECNESKWENLNESDEDVIWGRFRIRHMISSKIDGVDHVFCGHTIVKKPTTLGNITYIDTGAYSEGVLSIADLSKLDPEHPKRCITRFTAAGAESFVA